jgi:hypothetical protein
MRGPAYQRLRDRGNGQAEPMFLFFSNGLGCFGSLLVSAVITLVLLLLLNVL